jgi:hypothetical protein
MRCILDHGKLTLVAESNFEEGYLGELLENKMQGTAKRDTLGNISQIEFFKKDISSEEGRTAIIDSVRNGIPLPITELDNDYYNESEEMESVTDEEYENAEKWEIIEELDDQSNEEILTGINELNAEYDEGDLITGSIANNSIYKGKDPDVSFFKGMFQSFGDAPNGFREELQEVTWALGAEYWFRDVFAFRAGYFNENPNKGARQYFSLGAGFKYTTIKIDFSYLISTSKVVSPLEGTLRFGLTFNFGDEYDEY